MSYHTSQGEVNFGAKIKRCLELASRCYDCAKQYDANMTYRRNHLNRIIECCTLGSRTWTCIITACTYAYTHAYKCDRNMPICMQYTRRGRGLSHVRVCAWSRASVHACMYVYTSIHAWTHVYIARTQRGSGYAVLHRLAMHCTALRCVAASRAVLHTTLSMDAACECLHTCMHMWSLCEDTSGICAIPLGVSTISGAQDTAYQVLYQISCSILSLSIIHMYIYIYSFNFHVFDMYHGCIFWDSCPSVG